MRKILKIITAALALILLIPCVGAASESTSYTYTISVNGEWVRTQDAYLPGEIMLDAGELNAPEDLFLYGGKLYIADVTEDGTGGRLLVFDRKTGRTQVLGEGLLVNPSGIFVNEEAIFVADKGAAAVFKLSHSGEVLLTLSRPDNYLFSDKSIYLPTGVAVTSQGIIFVCGEGAYEGLMQFDRDGEFQGYFAANSTNLSFSERLEELLFSEEQMSQLLNRIPRPLYNLDISDRDLIYTVTQLEANTLWSVAEQDENAVKYHNMAGQDILSSLPVAGEHNFTDIAAYRDGLSYAVTSTGIIYEYMDDGSVVFSFGGMATSDRSGHFTNAVAIDVDEAGNIYILDKERAYVQLFFPTEFANATHEALYNLQNGSYAQSEQIWLDLLSLNGMSLLAHSGYGQVLYQQMRYEEAAREFQIVKNVEKYSECMWEIRNAWFQRNMPLLLAALCLAAAIPRSLRFLRKRGILKKRKSWNSPMWLEVKRQWGYMKGMLRNPFDEFWYLKAREHGSVRSATVIFAAAFILYMLDMCARSFTFHLVDTEQGSVLTVAVLFLIPAFLWVVGNFMVSAINDGEGSLRSVYLASAYSLVPYVLIAPFVILGTYVLTLNEAVVVHYLWAIAILWSAGLLCMSVREIHNYTVRETVKIIFLTLFFMVMAVVVSVILYLIGQQVVLFVKDIVNEVIYHVKS